MNPDVGDEHLVKAAQEGDRDAFLNLYHRYFKQVFFRVKSRIPEQDVEDVTQDIFIAVVHSLDKFQQKSKFSTWLYTIVNRQIADYYRRFYRKGDHATIDIELAHSLKSGSNIAQTDEFIMLKQSIEALPDNYREVILMRFADGLSFADIAGQLDESLEAVKSRYRRAIQALRKQANRMSDE